MDVLDALRARHAVRDFDSRPVPKDVVMKILETATRSPSGGNGQPWEIFVASGEPLETIRKGYQVRAQAAAGGPPPGPGGPGRPAQPAFIQERMATIRRERMLLMGLDPADPASGKVFMSWGARLFGAPALVVVCMHKDLNCHMDLGMLVQSICLAAQGYGVDSLIAAGLIAQQDILRKELEIPEDYSIVIGIGLGYPKPDSLINTYHSPRRPIEEVVRYKN